MKLAVFGATGGTGPYVLRQAVRRGHAVTAFARDPAAVIEPSALTAIVTGDARDIDAAGAAIRGQDAVILTVSGRGEAGVATEIARTVTAAMAAEGVPRLVATSSYAIVATKPALLAPLVRRLFATAFADQATADDLVRASGLDWTIARATRLLDKPAEQRPRISSELFAEGPYALARGAWADVLIELAENGRREIHRTVNVTG